MNSIEVMKYPLLVWVITMAWILAAWLAAVTVWIIRSHLRWNKFRQDIDVLSNLFVAAVHGLSKRITTIDNKKNDVRSFRVNSGRQQSSESLTAKPLTKNIVRIKVEESESQDSTEVRENSNC